MDRGNVSILTTLVLSFIVVLIILLYDAGRIFVARARIGAAADRAAYAGAAVLADGLNNIARENRMIHSAWQKLTADFNRDTQKNRDAALERIGAYEDARDFSRARMVSISERMFGRASAAALSLMAKNAPRAEGRVFSGGEISLADDINPAAQQGDVSYNFVIGPDYLDPENIGGGSYHGLKFMIKKRAADAAIGVTARQIVSPLLLGERFGRSEVEIMAMSAAQVFGGSIENFAKGSEDASDVDNLYRPILIPSWIVGGER